MLKTVIRPLINENHYTIFVELTSNDEIFQNVWFLCEDAQNGRKW